MLLFEIAELNRRSLHYLKFIFTSLLDHLLIPHYMSLQSRKLAIFIENCYLFDLMFYPVVES